MYLTLFEADLESDTLHSTEKNYPTFLGFFIDDSAIGPETIDHGDDIALEHRCRQPTKLVTL